MKNCQFKLGDEIDSIYGKGTITHVDERSLLVSFKDGSSARLTPDGKLEPSNPYPVIWFPKTGSPPKIGERPKWKPKKPTWCWVWNEENLYTSRLVIGYDDVGSKQRPYIAVRAFVKTPVGEGTVRWAHAEPCDPPYWWPEEWR